MSRGRLKVALLATTVAASGGLGWAPSAGAYAKVTRTFTPRWSMTAFDEAAEDGERVGRFAKTRPLTGAPTVLPIIGSDHSHAATHGPRALFYRVRLPNRAEIGDGNQTGWVAASAGTVGETPWRVTVDLSARRARISKYGVVVRGYDVAVGATASPTPEGRFFITEVVAPPRSAGVGPFVLATSAYARVRQEFGSRFGEVGLLGGAKPDRSATVGGVRFENAAVAWMGPRLTAGTPVSLLP